MSEKDPAFMEDAEAFNALREAMQERHRTLERYNSLYNQAKEAREVYRAAERQVELWYREVRRRAGDEHWEMDQWLPGVKRSAAIEEELRKTVALFPPNA